MTTEIAEDTKQELNLQPPKFYKVIIHNDDFTTVDFVITVLSNIFHKKNEEAIRITLDIHEKGEGIAGAPYTKEIAEEKTQETISFARKNGFPLLASFDEL